MADLFDIIGAGLSLAGGIAGASAANKAAKTQAAAQERASQNFRPYAELGDQAAALMSRELGPNALLRDFSLADLENDPGYQYRLMEGEKSIDRNAGARGKRYSGATLKSLQRFGQDYASNEVDRAYNRDANDRMLRYNFLAGPIDAGQGASARIAGLASNAGDARAAGAVGASNALWGGAADAFSGLNQSRYLKQLQNQYPVYGYQPR